MYYVRRLILIGIGVLLIACTNGANQQGGCAGPQPVVQNACTIQVTLTQADAAYTSDIYLNGLKPDLLISDSIHNVGKIARRNYDGKSDLNFFIKVFRTSNSTYKVYSNSVWATATQVDATTEIIAFEDNPTLSSDRDYNDAVINVQKVGCGGTTPTPVPVITSTPTPNATEAQLYTYNITTKDLNGGALSVASTDTCGGTVVNNGDGTGTYSFTVAGPTPPSSCVVGVQAGATIQTTAISITPVDDPPVFITAPPASATEDQLYTYSIATTDPDGGANALIVTAADTCGGTVVDNGDGTGTYTVTVAGPTPPPTCNVGVRAGATAQTTTISITPFDDPAVFTSAPPPSATEDQLYTYSIVTADPDGGADVLSVTSADTCGGTAVDNGDGTGTYTVTVSGPTPPSTCVVGIQAGATAQTTTISVIAVDDPPVFITAPPESATEDQLYTYSIITDDPDGGADVLSVTSADTCGGTIVDNGDGSGTYTVIIAGPTPPPSCIVSVQAGATTQTTTISITPFDDPAVFTSVPPPSVTEDELYTYNITANDPDGGSNLMVASTDTCGGTIVDNGDGTGTYTVAGMEPPGGGATYSCTVPVTLTDANQGYTSDLYLDGASPLLLISNTRDNVGATSQLSYDGISALKFFIHVYPTYGSPIGYTGDTYNVFSDTIWAKVTTSDNNTTVAFEDIPDPDTSDLDYNDVVFNFDTSACSSRPLFVVGSCVVGVQAGSTVQTTTIQILDK